MAYFVTTDWANMPLYLANDLMQDEKKNIGKFIPAKPSTAKEWGLHSD